MYKPIALIIICIGLLSGIQACKKGENDPAFSLKSRMARLTGEWELEYSDNTFSDEDGIYYTSKFENGTFSEVFNSDSTTYEFESTLTFDRDGSFEMNSEESHENIRIEIFQAGIWNFLQANESLDLKEKEGINLSTLETQEKEHQDGSHKATYSESLDDDNSLIWYIDRLSNKELHLKLEQTSTFEDGTFNTIIKDEIYKKL